MKKSTTTSGRQDYYGGADFYIGATVEFNKHRFVLIEADEYAYNFMEQHHDEVIQCYLLYVSFFLCLFLSYACESFVRLCTRVV